MNKPATHVPDALAAASNETLRATVAGLVAGEPTEQLLGRLLREAAAVCGAHVGLMFALDRATGRPRAEAVLHQGRLVDLDAEPLHRVWRDLGRSEESVRIFEQLQTSTSIGRMEDIRAQLWPPGLPWHDAMGHRFLMRMQLVHGAQVVGGLGLGFTDEPALDPAQLWAMDALTQQLSLVVVQAAAAEDAREAVRVAERRAAADQRAAELQRSDRAMQRVIDAMASQADLKSVVPATLQAAAEAFEIDAAGFFEHVGSVIYLRFWLLEGRVLGPDELPQLGDHLSLMRDLAHGFQVAHEHLGENFLHRSGPMLVDHGTATASPALHRFACARGWRHELNVPLMIEGLAAGAMTLYRPDGRTFGEADITLAVLLSKQLALALHAERVAAKASELDLARAREAALAALLEQESRTSTALRRLTEALATLRSPDDWMPRVLQVAGEAFDIGDAAYCEHPGDTVHLRLWLSKGQIFSPQQVDAARSPTQAFLQSMIDGYTVPPDYLGQDLHARTSLVVIHHRTATSVPRFHRFASSRGYDWELNVPLFVGGRAIAHIALYRPEHQPFGPADIATADALAQLVGVGIEAFRAAGRTRELAVAQERGRLAADIHDSLAQSFTSIALQCEVLGARLPEASSERRTADVIERTARRGLAEARASVQALRALPEGDNALAEALAELAEHCNVRGSIDCRFEGRAGRCPLGASAQETVLRVAQEATNNALRHARCTVLRLRLDWDTDEVVLTVQDNGRGLPAGKSTSIAAGAGSGGYGLAGMAERAERVGGRCTVESEPGKGVKVTLRLPRAR